MGIGVGHPQGSTCSKPHWSDSPQARTQELLASRRSISVKWLMYTAAFLSTPQYLYMGTYGINLAVHCPLAEWAGAIPYVNSETKPHPHNCFT